MLPEVLIRGARADVRPPGCLFGPAVTTWFQFLNRLQFATPRRAVVYRVYMDQFMFAPGT